MTTWTDIPDTVLEPGKPIRSVDTLALRDNPIAIAGGAAGAPRIVTNAIQDANVTAAKLATNSVTTVKIADANVTTAKLATNERMTTANVLAATAGASLSAVGSYAFLCFTNTGAQIVANSTEAGSLLATIGVNVGTSNTSNSLGTNTGSLQTGTWRAMGHCQQSGPSARAATVWLRIS